MRLSLTSYYVKGLFYIEGIKLTAKLAQITLLICKRSNRSFISSCCSYFALVLMQDALPSLNLHKKSVGCNSFFASKNPFHDKVLGIIPNSNNM